MDQAPVPPRLPATPPDADEHVRTRLLKAAVRVFDRKGYAGASVREIAEQAGVTKPTLYYHFGSKEGLLVAILTQAQHEFTHHIELALQRRGTAIDRIIALCQDLYGLFAQNVPVARVAHAVFLGPPDMAPPFDLTVFESAFRRAVERMVAEGQAAGELRPWPPSDVARAVEGILQGCNECQLHPMFNPVGPDVLGRLITLLFEGVANTPLTKGAP